MDKRIETAKKALVIFLGLLFALILLVGTVPK